METVKIKPFVWQMIKQAIDELNGKATYSEIKQFIHQHWEDVNEATINAQIIVLTVNQKSRVHYPENKKPRISDGTYDLLYSIGRGAVVKYDPVEHGIWEIYKNDFDVLGIRKQEPSEAGDELSDEELQGNQDASGLAFALEAQLRDFLIENLKTIVKDQNLKLYEDSLTGRDGKEYPTKVGFIDILTVDETGNFVVFELKLSRGADKTLGQIQRYMGWVKKHLAGEKQVSGVIVAKKMDEKLKYAVSVAKDIRLYEYHMQFNLSEVGTG